MFGFQWQVVIAIMANRTDESDASPNLPSPQFHTLMHDYLCLSQSAAPTQVSSSAAPVIPAPPSLILRPAMRRLLSLKIPRNPVGPLASWMSMFALRMASVKLGKDNPNSLLCVF